MNNDRPASVTRDLPPTLQLSPSLHIQQPHARLPEAPCSPLWSLPWAATQWRILPQTQLRWGFVPSPLCIFHLWLSLPMPPKHSESMSSQNILQESPSSLPEQQHYNDKPLSCDAQHSASLLWTRPLGAHSRDPVSMSVVTSCCLANYRQHRIHSFSGHLYCQIRPVCTPIPGNPKLCSVHSPLQSDCLFVSCVFYL